MNIYLIVSVLGIVACYVVLQIDLWRTEKKWKQKQEAFEREQKAWRKELFSEKWKDMKMRQSKRFES